MHFNVELSAGSQTTLEIDAVGVSQLVVSSTVSFRAVLGQLNGLDEVVLVGHGGTVQFQPPAPILPIGPPKFALRLTNLDVNEQASIYVTVL